MFDACIKLGKCQHLYFLPLYRGRAWPGGNDMDRGSADMSVPVYVAPLRPASSRAACNITIQRSRRHGIKARRWDDALAILTFYAVILPYGALFAAAQAASVFSVSVAGQTMRDLFEI